jgi:hypothetical protein
MGILEAFDLTGSLRDAAELADCSHHTVGRSGHRGLGGAGWFGPPRPVRDERAEDAR